MGDQFISWYLSDGPFWKWCPINICFSFLGLSWLCCVILYCGVVFDLDQHQHLAWPHDLALLKRNDNAFDTNIKDIKTCSSQQGCMCASIQMSAKIVDAFFDCLI